MKVVRLSDEVNKRKAAVKLLKELLEKAEADELTAFCGVALFDSGELGTFRSQFMLADGFYFVLGAIEDLKHEILTERDIEEGILL